MKRWSEFLGLLIVMATLITTYLPSLDNDYALDDQPIIKNNPLLIAPGNFATILISPYWPGAVGKTNGLYRPLTIASFKVTRWLSGDLPRADHLGNILAHAAVGGLLFGLILEFGISVWGALLLALLYGTHPVHSEVVASLVGRGDIMATLFFLCAALCVVCWPKLTVGRAIGVGALMLVSLGFKESTVMGFLLLPILRWLVVAQKNGPRKEGTQKKAVVRQEAWRIGAAVAGATLVYLIIRGWVLGGLLVQSGGLAFFGRSFIQMRLDALAFDSFFFEKLFKPLPLLPHYASGVIHLDSPSYYARILFSATFLTGCLLWIKRQVHQKKLLRSGVAAALLLFLIAALPVCNLVITIGTEFGERLVYFPSLFLVLAFCGPRLKHQYVISVVAMVTITIFSFFTHQRMNDWRNNYTLAAAATRDFPRNYWVRLGLANELKIARKLDEAVKQFEAALKLHPYPYNAHNALGEMALNRGDYNAAIDHYEQVLQFPVGNNPHVPHYNLFLAHLALHHDDTALAHLLEAVRILNDDTEALGNMRHILANNPQAVGMHTTLIDHFVAQSQKEQAKLALQASLILLPDIKYFQKQLEGLLMAPTSRF